YQNELTSGRRFDSREQQAWLSNFGCNSLEFLAQYNARFHTRYRFGLDTREGDLRQEIEKLEADLASMTPASAGFEKAKSTLAKKKEVLDETRKEIDFWTRENYERLSDYQKNLFQNAFRTNTADPDFMQLE